MHSENTPILEDINLKNSLNSFFRKPGFFSHILYFTIISILVITSVMMYFLRIPVYVETNGLIRPAAEVRQITAPLQGIIQSIYISENQFAVSGDTILRFDSDKEILQKTQIINEIDRVGEWLGDLEQILPGKYGNPVLSTQKYKIEYQLFRQEKNRIDIEKGFAEKNMNRLETLFGNQYVSKRDLEESQIKYKSLILEGSRLISEKSSQWNIEFNELVVRKTNLENQLIDLNFLIDKAIITAPVSGIIQGIRNKYTGEFCNTGNMLFTILPDTDLIAIVYLPPKDIGLIFQGQSVMLLIDSYDYKYWGTVSASCLNISKDIEIFDNQVLFRVECKMEKNAFLTFKGKKVKPSNGMTLKARFLVSEKNAWQLIKDSVYGLLTEKHDEIADKNRNN